MIGWKAFYRCVGLTSVTIPANFVEEIGSEVFFGYTSLTGVTLSPAAGTTREQLDTLSNMIDHLSDIIIPDPAVFMRLFAEAPEHREKLVNGLFGYIGTAPDILTAPELMRRPAFDTLLRYTVENGMAEHTARLLEAHRRVFPDGEELPDLDIPDGE